MAGNRLDIPAVLRMLREIRKVQDVEIKDFAIDSLIDKIEDMAGLKTTEKEKLEQCNDPDNT